jgi:hypothetical protein
MWPNAGTANLTCECRQRGACPPLLGRAGARVPIRVVERRGLRVPEALQGQVMSA